jgi:hypothetical protein
MRDHQFCRLLRDIAQIAEIIFRNLGGLWNQVLDLSAADSLTIDTIQEPIIEQEEQIDRLVINIVISRTDSIALGSAT